MKQNKTPTNNQYQPHGYWEYYHSNGQLAYKGNYINGKENGWWESYWSDGKLCHKGNYIRGKRDGLWIENWSGKQINFYI
jgi:antitoxin component YwqK of YwqJK toxin-antitoxin module